MRYYKVYFITILTVASFAASVYFGGGMGCDNGNANVCGTNVSGGGCGGPDANDTSVPTTPPTVSSTNPVNGATGVAINRKIAVVFSQEMDPLTITTTTFQVTGPGSTPVAGTVDMDSTNQMVIFTPATNLAPDTLFTATITTGAMGPTCNALASNFVWTFTTGATADTTPPTVTLLNPPDAATGACLNRPITATFSEEMDPLTITTTTFQVTGPGSTPVAGTVGMDSTPNCNLYTHNEPGTQHPLHGDDHDGATDLAGNALAVNNYGPLSPGQLPV